MDGNFESGGFSSGSSMGGAQGGSGFDSSVDMGNFDGLQAESLNSTGMTSMDYLSEGVAKGYYKQDTEGIFSLEDVMSEAQEEMNVS